MNRFINFLLSEQKLDPRLSLLLLLFGCLFLGLALTGCGPPKPQAESSGVVSK